MWPLDLPAHAVLKLPGETPIPWAVFDWKCYLQSNPEVTSIIGDDDPSAVLEYYLQLGQKHGHSPNRMFDEQWHRLTYPQIAERVAAGQWDSAFDAYCRRGALDRSPHWLFDENFYRARYPELTDEVLAGFEIFNGYDHYLRHGSTENRIGHVLFDPTVYLSHFDPCETGAIRATGVFEHYLKRIESNEPELRTSIYFDPIWYLQRYPGVALEIATKRWRCGLHHYLCNDTPTAFDPLPHFSESWYLQRDTGLREVIGSRSFRNGYMHFLQYGAKEMRPPTASIDLAWYAAQPPVRTDLEHGRVPDAFAHWLTIGAPAGLSSEMPETEEITASQARHLFQMNAAALLPIAGRFGYNFECPTDPVISIVMAPRDDFAAMMATVASLRSSTTADLELIIVDRGSGDETRSIGQYVTGAQVLRFESDVGWSRAADAGRQLATAPAVLFLSGDARITPGSVDRALARLDADATTGAVGGMMLQAHGVIAQAGGILWNDGGTRDYLRGASPLEPEANFVRDIDFCAPAFLLIRAELLSRLDGFDNDCADSYAAVDLCLRIVQAGFRVVYDPSVMIVLCDAAQNNDPPGDHFLRKHASGLTERFAADGPIQVFARHSGKKPHRVLFIEDTVPLRRLGSGFVRANDLVQMIASLGCAVTVFPVNGCDHNLAHLFGDMPSSVEVMHTLALDRLAAFLEARPGYYDTIWVARTHNLALTRPILSRLTAEGTLEARIVLDTEALTPHREAMQAELLGQPYDLPAAMQAVLADADICQQIVAVSSAEADALRSFGFPSVQVIGHMIEPRPTPRPFAQRSGILFVGAIHNEDSPNFDSLVWFVDSVLPLIETELKWETRLTIAGHIGSGVDLSRFEHHQRITLRGPVADLQPLYNAHRVFVAPTRYAAGAPYKVLEAASRGLPVVATRVLCSELDWRPEHEMLIADTNDPVTFAGHVLTLYRNETQWRSIRKGALRRLQQENGRENYVRAVASVLMSSPIMTTRAGPVPENDPDP